MDSRKTNNFHVKVKIVNRITGGNSMNLGIQRKKFLRNDSFLSDFCVTCTVTETFSF